MKKWKLRTDISYPVDPQKKRKYFSSTFGIFDELPRRNVSTFVRSNFATHVVSAGTQWERIHLSFPAKREYTRDDIGNEQCVSVGYDMSRGPHSVYYTDGMRLLRISTHWSEEMILDGDGSKFCSQIATCYWVRRYISSYPQESVGNGRMRYTGGVIPFNHLEFME